MNNSKKVTLIIICILVLDQWTKIYVKTHFLLGESVPVFSWFRILFIENEGAAWGVKIPGEWGKIILSTFRIFAIFAIGYWIKKQIRQRRSQLFLISTALVFAGALGNIIDSVFYGVIFNDSTIEIAALFPNESYGTLLHGKVVDMISLPLIDSTWPSWIPLWGGQPFRFFEYIFNVADASITLGGFGLFFAFQKESKRQKRLGYKRHTNLN